MYIIIYYEIVQNAQTHTDMARPGPIQSYLILFLLYYRPIFECLFIFSLSKLLLNAASYDGEIWHTAA